MKPLFFVIKQKNSQVIVVTAVPCDNYQVMYIIFYCNHAPNYFVYYLTEEGYFTKDFFIFLATDIVLFTS